MTHQVYATKSSPAKTLTSDRRSAGNSSAKELVESARRNTSIDWQLKESVQAKMRMIIKRILRKYKYPPDDSSTGEYTVSVNKVLSQAEFLAEYWSEN